MPGVVPRSLQRAQQKTVESATNSSAIGEHTAGETAEDSAKTAHLRYVSDRQPGLTRHRVNDEFVYRDLHGHIINDRNELQRIRAIAIPPAWKSVWICPDPSGHLQATGRDARGRKQYRYHTRWRSVRDQTKYEHMLIFADSLPTIRRRVDIDLAKPALPREKVLASVVRLMERTLARVGNSEYVRQNDSFGLTTLRNRHARIIHGRIELDFRGKSGIHHHCVINDRKLTRIVKNCRDLPGSELFQYIDDDGIRHSIDSSDVNDYLRQISGREITAKDFRTWAATNLAALALHELNEATPTKAGTLQVIKQVAAQLGNTPAVCRKCYIHPAVLESYLAGSLQLKSNSDTDRNAPEMWSIERQLIRFLNRRITTSEADATLKMKLKGSLDAVRSKRRGVKITQARRIGRSKVRA
jgi:DNA topoisomerase I